MNLNVLIGIPKGYLLMDDQSHCSIVYFIYFKVISNNYRDAKKNPDFNFKSGFSVLGTLKF